MKKHVQSCLEALLAVREQLHDSYDPSIIAELDNTIAYVQRCQELEDESCLLETTQHGLEMLGRVVGLLNGVAEFINRLR